MRIEWIPAVICCLLAGCAGGGDVSSPKLAEPETHAACRGVRVYFAHQSVGSNILEGVARMDRSVRILPASENGTRDPAALIILHGAIGQNGDPAGKCRAFRKEIDRVAADIEIAMLKLCYADFNAAVDVAALSRLYMDTLRSLERRHPAIRFIAVTSPLTVATPRWKQFLKTALFRESSDAANSRRHQFNERLRKDWHGILFDLGAAESTPEDASLAMQGQPEDRVPALRSEYSSDGGHLNSKGQARVAQAMLAALALAAIERRNP